MKNKTDLVSGEKPHNALSFWGMWNNDLPGSFPKMKFINELSGRWGISVPNVYARLKNEAFMNLKSDLLFLFNKYGIAFDYKEKGFFLDRRQYDLIKQNEELEGAKMFGLSKSIS
ncbi:MAG: hypothetical protein ABIN80_28555 [Dyadobacter sp.]|uniref:hypothetical protein n=1 Tax=Dyadobacter sp. TaxID=1914288 RepID=UPI003267B6C4